MKFSISFGSVLQELDFYDRIPAVAEIGYDAIEFNPNSADLERVAKLASDNRLRISACWRLQPQGRSSVQRPAGGANFRVHPPPERRRDRAAVLLTGDRAPARTAKSC